MERVEILDALHEDAVLQVAAHISFYVHGIADLLEVAASRDFQLNTPSFVTLVRSVVEPTGRLDWLLDRAIPADIRCRRYLTWMFENLRSDQLILDGFSHVPGDALAAAATELHELEVNLITSTKRAGWEAAPRSTTPGAFAPAGLLQLERGKREAMPGFAALAERIAPSGPFLYQLLSGTSHGSRLAVLTSIEQPSGDQSTTTMRGTSIPADLLFTILTTAALRVVTLFEEWAAADAGKSRRVLQRLLA